MANFLKIEIETNTSEQADILIADLSEINFYAFEQEGNTLIAYIKEVDFDEGQFEFVLGIPLGYKKTIVKEENWNQEWERGFKPVIITDFAAIRAAFQEPVKNVKHELIITPKMSFGTGHHATTFLMVELMETINFKNKTVVDFGTGTGVLAILAEKLGASKVMAVDYDEWSIANTIENIQANDCKNISVEKRDNLSGMEEVDILIANINLNILTEASASISNLLKKGSLLLTSGFLLQDEEAMEKTFAEKKLVKTSVFKKDGWLAILYEKW